MKTNETVGTLRQKMFGWKVGVMVLSLLPAIMDGQIPKSGDKYDNLETGLQEKSAINIVQPAGVALEATLNPDHYFVGPSDIIAVNIWITPPVNCMLTVTPEGTLLIPTVGEIKVADLTLTKAKEKILLEIRKKYTVAQATATLIKPRPIIISVTGHVLNPGLYTLTSVDRATRAIEEANKMMRTQIPEELKLLLDEMSVRNIVLKHKDGSSDRVDITKFLALKEDRWNPYLREGDVVVVPRKSRTKNVFGIYGEVNVPGRYELVDGDSILDALSIGQGVTRLALTDSVEFSRLSKDGNTLSVKIIDLNDIVTGRQQNFPLEPGDRIVVKPKVDLREDYRVTIEGEVLYPGTYPITKDRTKLSTLIRQAGGFTEYASLNSAQITRSSFHLGAETELMMSLRGNPNIEDAEDYNTETRLRIRRGSVSCDFEKLFIGKDSTQDIIVQSEDTVIVPSLKNTIYVFGQVVSPGHVPWSKGQSARYYVEKAGGYTDHARRGDVKVIKGKSKQWFDPGETSVEEGDYIWVPMNPDRSFAYYATITSQLASVLSVIVGAALVIITVSK